MNKRKTTFKMIPTFLIVTVLVIGGGLKISEFHPMLHHLVEMGFYPIMKLLGLSQIAFGLLYLFNRTHKAGLILLTAYFAGAIAVEIPYNMMGAPTIILLLIWLAAWLRNHQIFKEITSIHTTQLT